MNNDNDNENETMNNDNETDPTKTAEPTSAEPIEVKPLINPLTSPNTWAELLAELAREPTSCILYVERDEPADARGPAASRDRLWHGQTFVWRPTISLLRSAGNSAFAGQCADALDMPESSEEAAVREGELALLGAEIANLGAPLTSEKLSAWIDSATDAEKSKRRGAVCMFLWCSKETIEDRKALWGGLGALGHTQPHSLQAKVAAIANDWSIAHRAANVRSEQVYSAEEAVERDELRKETERVAAAHANPTAPDEVPDNVREALHEDEVAYLEPVTGFWFAMRGDHARRLAVLINSTPGTGGFVDCDPYYNRGSVDEIKILAKSELQLDLDKVTLSYEKAAEAEKTYYEELISTLVEDKRFRRDFLKAVAAREAKVLCQDREVPEGTEKRIAASLASVSANAMLQAMLVAETMLPPRPASAAECAPDWGHWDWPDVSGVVTGMAALAAAYKGREH